VALIYISGAWVAGILLGAQANLPPALILLGLLPLSLLIFRRHRWAIVLLSLSLLTFFGGATYYQQSLPDFDEGHLATYNDQGQLAFKGTLFQEPEVREKTGRLYLAATEIWLDGQWREIEGQALLFVPRFSDYSYGDVLLVTGEPETPPRFDSFDYQGYLANQRIHTTMLYPQIEVLDTGQGFPPLEWIYSLRGQMADSLAEAMPEPQASLAQGITLSIRDNIPSSVRQDFAYSGTAHLLAISGLLQGNLQRYYSPALKAVNVFL
jgi:competence protein ComEC